jgi:thioredoxin-related protein
MYKILIGALIALTALTANAQTANKNTSESAVKWYTIEEAQALNAKAPRKLFIDLYTDWCGWCKVLDQNTFSDPTVAKYLNTHFYPVKFNGEGKESAVFNGQTFEFNPQYKSHELAIAIMRGEMSYPTLALLSEKLQLFPLLKGYQSPEDLLPVLVFLAQDYYEKMNWEEFRQQWPEIMKTL